MLEIAKAIFRMSKTGKTVKLIWVPAHIGVEGNELADRYAKSAANRAEVGMAVNYSKAEVKCIIKGEMKKKWQEEWDRGTKGRHLYRIQKVVGKMRDMGRGKKDEDIISRMRFGHTGLNSTLKIIGKHETGRCDYCNRQETIEHVMMECPKYQQERQSLKERLESNKIKMEIKELLKLSSGNVGYRDIFLFLDETGLSKRI